MSDTLKLTVTLDPYEVDGSDKIALRDDKTNLKLKPHWNLSHMVVVTLGDRSVTVSARELERALRACTL